MLSPLHKSRRPWRSQRESPGAQLQSDRPPRYKNMSIHHTHTAMHDNGTAMKFTKAVRGDFDVPARAWQAASTRALTTGMGVAPAPPQRSRPSRLRRSKHASPRAVPPPPRRGAGHESATTSEERLVATRAGGAGSLKRSGDRGWETKVKWLSGLSLCVCVRTCFVGCLSKAPLFPSRALLK